MKYLLFVLLALSYTAGAAGGRVCVVHWQHNATYKDGSPVAVDGMRFELWSRGEIIDGDIPGEQREYRWHVRGQCPSCLDLAIRAVDINDQRRNSYFVFQECPLSAPVLCR